MLHPAKDSTLLSFKGAHLQCLVWRVWHFWCVTRGILWLFTLYPGRADKLRRLHCMFCKIESHQGDHLNRSCILGTSVRAVKLRGLQCVFCGLESHQGNHLNLSARVGPCRAGDAADAWPEAPDKEAASLPEECSAPSQQASQSKLPSAAAYS